MRSNAAKAAAIMVFTSGVEDYDMAVRVFDALAADVGTVMDTLDKFPGTCRWSRVDALDDGDWWEEVEMLAINIDEARAHFLGRTT
jgi:hypothetical protein